MKKFNVIINDNNGSSTLATFVVSYTIPLLNAKAISFKAFDTLTNFDCQYYCNDFIEIFISKKIYKTFLHKVEMNLYSKQKFVNYLLLALNTLYYNHPLYREKQAQNRWDIMINEKSIYPYMDSRLLPLFFVFELENIFPVSSNSLPFIHNCRRQFYHWLMFWNISPLNFESLIKNTITTQETIDWCALNNNPEYQNYISQDFYHDLFVTHLSTKFERIILSYSKYYFKAKAYNIKYLNDTYPKWTHPILEALCREK